MSEIRANTVSNAAGTGPATLTGQYAAKAWVNFNGTGTVAIRESGNVASITDNGTGNYTINFSNAFGAADYAAPFAGSRTTSAGATAMANVTSLAVSSFRTYITDDTGTLSDAEQVQHAIHGDLA